MQIQENVALAPLTTLGVGGPARYFAEARSEADIREAVAFAKSHALALFVLGGGSNLLVADSGFPGLVLKIGIRGISQYSEGRRELFDSAAGEDWDALVERTVNANCAGLECLSGIPGTVGGTPVQNVGAYGQDVSETIITVRTLDLNSGEIVELSRDDCSFAYRSSRFNSVDRGRFIITRVIFSLHPGAEPKLEYADLRKFFAERDDRPSLQETRDAVRQIRRSKAMLIVDGDEDARSAGSFFKNPVIDLAHYERIVSEAASGVTVPKYPAGTGKVKVPAAWLVEQSGLHKGFALGPVGISRKHALAIVNHGGAMAADVVALKERIQASVRDRFGIQLQPEPVFLGFE